MEVAKFIQSCANSMADEQRMVITAEEWLEILNFQSAELLPEIALKHVSTIDLESLQDKTQIDLSSNEFEGITDVLEVWLIDANGKKRFYDNWSYHKVLKFLDLYPNSSEIDPIGYKNVKIVWTSSLPFYKSYRDEIGLENSLIPLLLKICVREALRRILNDHAKLDKYRTLVGRMNEYALMAMIRDLTTEIEFIKRKNRNTLPLIAF